MLSVCQHSWKDVHDSYAWLTFVPSGHRMWRRRPSQAAACLGFSVEDSWNGRVGGFQMSPFLPKKNQAQRQSTYRGRIEIGGVYCICPFSWSLHHDFVRDGRYSEKGWACTPHPPSPGWANFSIMMECTPESGLCPSVCTLCAQIANNFSTI